MPLSREAFFILHRDFNEVSMSKLATIRQLPQLIGQEVQIQGWVWNRRGSGKVRFLEVRDGSGFVQVVCTPQDMGEEMFEATRRGAQESTIMLRGVVAKAPKSPLGVEIQARSYHLLSASEDFPLGHKEHGTDFLMNNRHLWLRGPRQLAILQVRHRIIKAIRDYFDQLDFTLVDSPIFTANECEGSSTLFETPYFGQTAYLSQSGQLYAEAAARAVGKAYCFGPTFRAENSNTRRHLTEFWMVEPEVAFMDLQGDMDLAEGLVQFIIRAVLKDCEPQLKKLARDLEPLKACLEPFVRISYDEAVQILHEAGEDFPWGEDFGGGHETIISSKFGRPVFVHRYPKAVKAFYMKADPENPNLALCADLLAPEGYGEVIGGGQREDSLEALLEALAKHQIPEEAFSWYLDLRRYGSTPSAGFGLGVERTVAWICGLPHVRETIPFPRLPGRLHP